MVLPNHQLEGSDMSLSHGVGPTGLLLTTAEAAEQLRITTRTLRRWRKKGLIPSYKLGRGRVRILQSDVTDLLKASEEK
jgi:excisionase family DNA binding protein